MGSFAGVDSTGGVIGMPGVFSREALDLTAAWCRHQWFQSPSPTRLAVVMVTPLISAPGGSAVSDAVLALFVSDADDAGITDAGVLQKLYSLTHSEAELVRLLTQGFTLEGAAESRGVSMNTARSHLKHVFAKTETCRQGELLRLVIGGVGAIRHEWLAE